MPECADVTIEESFDEDGVTFEHGKDGYWVKLSYAEIRDRGTIPCGVCGVELSSLDSLIATVDEGIAEAQEYPNGVLREAVLSSLMYSKRQLLGTRERRFPFFRRAR